MIVLFLIFASALTLAAEMPGAWSSAFKIQELHEFYPENKVITEPQESWQHLFSVLVLNEKFAEQKDCVFYSVPGDLPGKLKVKTIDTQEDCADHLLEPGVNEWDGVHNLQFSRTEEGLKIGFSQKKKIVSWEIITPKFRAPDPSLHLSSVELKSPRYLLLAKGMDSEKTERPKLKKDQLCHSINDECEEVSEPICQLCEGGWYEIPNGCAQGPKYCGIQNCGGINLPACRRGRVYQRKVEKFDCRVDPSFAYCQKGLTVQCEGQKAYCR